MDPLYIVLMDKFGTEREMAKAFGLERATHFKSRVPERIALLCHLSRDIPYTYNPSDYSRDAKGLNLNLKKVTTNDQSSTKQIQREAA